MRVYAISVKTHGNKTNAADPNFGVNVDLGLYGCWQWMRTCRVRGCPFGGSRSRFSCCQLSSTLVSLPSSLSFLLRHTACGRGFSLRLTICGRGFLLWGSSCCICCETILEPEYLPLPAQRRVALRRPNLLIPRICWTGAKCERRVAGGITSFRRWKRLLQRQWASPGWG